MNETDKGQVSNEAAEVYEQFFVPALFSQWPEQLLGHVGVRAGDRVLDVGCGTGALTRVALQRVGDTGLVTGIDPNEGMLAVAGRTCPAAELRRAVAQDLPFRDGSFDRVVSQFALMFVADRGRAAAEMERVLRPGGSVGALTWAAIDSSPGYAAMLGLLRRLFGSEPAEALLDPFRLGTPELLSAAFVATFPEVEVVRLQGEARFASIDAWVQTDIMGWTLRDLIDDDQYHRLRDAALEDLGRFAGPDGTVRFAAPALLALVRGTADPTDPGLSPERP